MTKSKARQARSIFASGEASPASPAPAETRIAEPARTYEKPLEESIALFKTSPGSTGTASLKEKLLQARYIGNLLRKFLLFETDDSLLVIDQHAAQERIMFEKLLGQIEKGSVEVQHLLTPVTFNLSAEELVLWEENKGMLGRTGFETTLFGKNALAVHSHPATVTEVERSVRNLLSGGSLAKLEPEQIARMACRSSVMFGFAMNPEQAAFQRSSLLECRNPFTCPHGRPTVVEIPTEALLGYFERK
jgi:DNA mismatch repair protein MutL